MKKWLFILAFAALIFLLPQILSTQLGVSLMSSFVKGDIAIEQLSLSWLGPQTAKGVRYRENDLTLTAKEIKVEGPLWNRRGLIVKGGAMKTSDASLSQVSVTMKSDYTTKAKGKSTFQGQTGDFTLSLLPKNGRFQGEVSLSAFPLVDLNTAIDLNAHFEGTIANNLLTLTQPAKVHWKTAPFNSYGDATIDSLTLPLKDPKQGAVALTALAPQFSQFTDVSLNLKSDNLSKLINYNVRAASFSSKGQIKYLFDAPAITTETDLRNFPTSYFGKKAVDLLGSTINLQINGLISHGQIDAKGALSSPLLTTSPFEIETDGAIKFVKPFTLDYKLSQGLTEPATIHGDFQSMEISRDYQEIEATGRLTSSTMRFKSFSLENLTAHVNGKEVLITTLFATPHLKTPAKVKAVTTTQLSDVDFSLDLEEGELEGTLTFEDMETLQLDLKADSFPLTHFSPKGAVFGKSVDIEAVYKRSKGEEEIDLTMKSDRFKLQGAFELGDALILKGGAPAKLEWVIDQQTFLGFDHLIDPDPNSYAKHAVKVANPAKLKAEIKSLDWPLHEKGTFSPDLDDVALEASIKMSDLRLNDIVRKDSIALEDLKGTIEKERGDDTIEFNLGGELVSNEEGAFTLEGTIANFGREGSDALDELTAEFRGKLNGIPTSFFDTAFRIWGRREEPASAIFGETLYATVEGKLNKSSGTTKLIVNSSNFKGVLDTIIVNRKLMLQSPIYAQIVMTEKLSALLSQNAGVSVLSMREPIKLYVDNQGFSLPIAPVDLSGFQVGRASLDFGQVVVQNRGGASALDSLFKQQTGGSIHLWFAPMDMRVRSGVANIERTEILFNRALDVCTWGAINLNRQYVDMILGLTAQSLSAALGISGISSDYVLKIPVRGPFGNVQVDTGSATAKIAFLIARKQALPQAGIWGNVLGAVGDLMDDQSDVPPPKRPFPWEMSQGTSEAPKSPFTPKLPGRKKKGKKGYVKELIKILR